MIAGSRSQTVRAASQADSLINEMRALVQASDPVSRQQPAEEIERAVSYRVTTVLMLLLLSLVFITSAVPDIGPSLAGLVQSHL
jgi:hypothetical protein